MAIYIPNYIMAILCIIVVFCSTSLAGLMFWDLASEIHTHRAEKKRLDNKNYKRQ